MARIAFDIDEKDKREIKIRLAKESRTLSEVMRTLCLYYKDFGLPPDKLSLGKGDIPHSQGDMRHCTITLYLDEEKVARLGNLVAATDSNKSDLVSFLLGLFQPRESGGMELDTSGDGCEQLWRRQENQGGPG